MNPNKILLVDDDSDDRFFMKVAIESFELPVQIVELESIEQLLGYLRNAAADAALIILDVNMPVVSGLEGIPLIRAIAGAGSLPIAMISTSPSPELENRAAALGVSSFDAKPNSIQEFNTLMGRLVNKHIRS